MGDGSWTGRRWPGPSSRPARRRWAECGWGVGLWARLWLNLEGAHGPASRSAAAPTAKGPRCSCNAANDSIHPPVVSDSDSDFDLDRPRPQPAVARHLNCQPRIGRRHHEAYRRPDSGRPVGHCRRRKPAAERRRLPVPLVVVVIVTELPRHSQHPQGGRPPHSASTSKSRPHRAPACAVSCVRVPILTGRAAVHAAIRQRPPRPPQLHRRRDRRLPHRQVRQEPGAAVCAAHQARCLPARHHRRGRRA